MNKLDADSHKKGGATSGGLVAPPFLLRNGLPAYSGELPGFVVVAVFWRM